MADELTPEEEHRFKSFIGGADYRAAKEEQKSLQLIVQNSQPFRTEIRRDILTGIVAITHFYR